jgi:hypothetical protein
MKPSDIYAVMDLARRARTNDEIFNPLFVGAPGIGKSQIVQDWCKQHSLPFIDLRAAYLEAPDLIGFPSIEVKNDRQITVHNIPEFWPQETEWEGVILLEEPNRGTTSVMNTFMQLLTDRKVHKYELPKKAIIVGCINPESEYFDVNTMDAALKDRFEIFEVVYDKPAFLSYMKKKDWDVNLQMFVETGTWKYTPLEDLGTKYLSPRTFSKLNAALKSEVPESLELTIYESILGKNVGQSFYQFMHDEQPVLYKDILESTSKALRRLTKFSDPKDYKSVHVTITIRDIVEKNDIKDELLSEVCLVIPADQALDLLKQLSFKRKDDALLERIIKEFPEVKKYLKAVLVK